MDRFHRLWAPNGAPASIYLSIKKGERNEGLLKVPGLDLVGAVSALIAVGVAAVGVLPVHESVKIL